MTEQQAGGARAAAIRPATTSTVSHCRRISRALDVLCAVDLPEPSEVDYDAMGLTLGYAERRAAGLALLERAA